ncbi:sensory transduction histidine kinase [Methanosarcina barkeri str. Wiesmoor]|uniref:Sensory transduction histidine kinase n=2 Tax=Methanosarcina barkeri TaxID=2208 RepID=A0A0E3QJS9_METBA|nr:PocR ligand-binding domain-containing protein [Methanosarcina barkeri]AKB51114.1 sensory transduction histidine kinase [Methanosarcina barkeri str. Wiesmoor]
MTKDLELFPATNPNPVLSVATDCTVLYSNKAGEPLLYEWGVAVGGKLPSYVRSIVKKVISLNIPEKIKVETEKIEYLVGFYPVPEEKCVNIYGFDISDCDISNWREFEEKLPESEAGEVANLELADIIDVPAIQSLMDDFYRLVHIPMGLIDLKGNVLAGVAWQDICTKFHRIHPETCKNCIESDIKLSVGVSPGEFKLYRCKNNMWDVATPVMVGGKHVANIFSGQFFFEDEPVDYELFRFQARKYGFNEEEYIVAFEKVPRLSKEAVNTKMAFFVKLANILSQLSYSNFKFSQSLAESEILVNKLEKNREDLDRAQTVGNIGSWSLDVHKNELTWSDENHRIFGIQKGIPLTYETFLSKVHPDDREYVDRKWKAGLKGEPYDIEHRIFVDGQIKWVREKAYIEFDKDGMVTGGFGITQDITERKKSEEALKRVHDSLEAKVKERTSELEKAYESLMEEERRLSEAQKIAHVGNWDWDLKTDEVYWSHEMCRIFGCAPQKLFHTHSELLNFIHPEDRSYVDNVVKSTLNGGSFSIDHRIISAQGEERIVHAQGEVVFDEKKSPIRLRGTIQDITDHEKAEEKIRILADAVESSNDAIVTESFDGTIISWNKTAEQIYGYSAEEILGKNVSILEPDNLKGEIKKIIEKVKHGEKVHHYRTLRLKKDGTTTNVSITYSPVFDAFGELKAISAIARDITEQINTEKILAKAEEARKKEIHHRIKNNLQVISSLLDLQAEKFRSRECTENEEVLNAFRESQDRVMSIALIHKELHEGKVTDTLNISAYLERLVENLFQTYRVGNVNTSLKLEVEENIFFDMDVAVPLGIIINELVSNSLKYAFLGKDNGRIQIKLHREDSTEHVKKEQGRTEENYNGTDFTLIVSDNGIGISEKFNLEDSNSLGLQLVEVLVDQLGGEIELKRSSGTEFVIRFKVPAQN